MALHFESGVWQLKKWREELCGDHVEILRNPQNLTIAVADGLGSGVKANILATLTTKIAASMLRDGAVIDEVMATLAETLPVCRMRELAYSTIALLQVDPKGECYLAEFDTPDAFLLTKRGVQPLPRVERSIADRTVFESHFSLEANDAVLLITDGVVHAGLGNSLNMGWQWDNIAGYIDKLRRKGHPLRDIGSGLINTCSHLYGQRPGDDCTVVGAQAVLPRHVTVLSGPPMTRERDKHMSSRLMSVGGKKVICGGSSAQMVARETGLSLTTNIHSLESGLPPVAEMEGVDLVTEGVLTLTSALNIIRRFSETEQDITQDKLLQRKDGASRLANLLLSHTHVTFLVGRAVNEAHREVDGPRLGLREQIIDDLAFHLGRLDKNVQVEQY